MASPSQAMGLARKQGKLLLVAHISGDFAKNDPAARPLQVYRNITVADPRVVRELRERFVLVWQHVGEAAALQHIPVLKKGEKSPPPFEFAVTYLCLPDGRVLHFIPGYLTSDELLAELAWAEKCYAAAASLPEDEQPLAVRRAHLSAVAKPDHVLFSKRFPSRWKDDALAEGPSTVDLPAALAAARGVLDQSLAQRLGQSWPAKQGTARLQALAAHGSLGRELAHLVLAEFPLIVLDDLQRGAYETSAGQRYWQASRRREELIQWWRQARANEQPILLVVTADPFASTRAGEEFVWPLRETEAPPDLARFAVQVVSIDELATLIHDGGLPPVICRGAKRPPRYLIFNADGKRTELPIATSQSRLAQAMHASLEPGPAAGSASATGGSSDEK